MYNNVLQNMHLRR